jgi:hypothetical protein
MSISPNLLNLALWIGGILLSLAGVAWIVRCLFADRARGRRRCPSCWYDFAGLATDSRCPECGRDDLTERHLARTRRRWGLACLAFIPLIAGYITWATPRVFEEKSATGFFPTTFLVLAAPTLDAKAIDNANNLRGLTFARLNRGEIKRPWRWLWRQRVKLAHTLTGTPYIEVAWDDVKSIYPPPEPVPARIWDRSPINSDLHDPNLPTVENFGSGLEAITRFYWILAPGDPDDLSCIIGEHWLATGSAAKIQRARDVLSLLQRARADVLRGELPPQRRFDFTDVGASNAVLERLESTFVPAWEGTITLPQLAEKLSLAAGCPVDLDLEPATLNEYESTLKPAASPAASVRVTLGTLCTFADDPITWTVRDGRIIILRRPNPDGASTRLPPAFIDPQLAVFDISDLIAPGSQFRSINKDAKYASYDLIEIVTASVDPFQLAENGGDFVIEAVGTLTAVEADPPTIHLIGLLIDLIRQSESGFGTDRQRVLTWGELPRDRQSLCDAKATLSGTRSNPQIIAHNLDRIFGEVISDVVGSNNAELVDFERYKSLHENGGLVERLLDLKAETCPDAKAPRMNYAVLSTSTLLVIAPAPTQAKVADILREFEARRLAQPASTIAP